MDMLKRNLQLAIFGAVALVLAIVLAVLMQRNAAAAADYHEKVNALEAFLQKIRAEKIAVTEQNLETVEANYELIEERLERAREMLWQRTHIPVGQYSGVECKNILREETLRMARNLGAQGVVISPNAAAFSFGGILQADALPRPEEVPVILQQLEIVKELIRIAGNANLTELISVERAMGLNFHREDLYEIMPVNITVRGNALNVQRFLTALQQSSRVVFFVPYSTLTADDIAARIASGQAARTARGTVAPATPGVPFMEGMPMYPPGTPPREAAPAREALAPQIVELSDMAQATVRIDVIQFRNPNAAAEKR